MVALTKLLFVDQAPTIVDYTSVHLAADKAYPAMNRYMDGQLHRMVGLVNRREISDLLRAGAGTETVLQSIDLSSIMGGPGLQVNPTRSAKDDSPAPPVHQFTREAYFGIGVAVAEDTLAHLGELIANVQSLGGDLQADAIVWASQNAAKLVTNVSASTKEAIRNTILDGVSNGRTVDQIAQDIRTIIGLTTRDARRLLRFGQKLERDGAPLSEIAERLTSVRAGMIRERAISIARTESMFAANGGQQLTWDLALRRQVLRDERTRKRFIITPDDRLDTKVCEPMPRMEANQDVRISGVFTTPQGGAFSQAPVHTKCRCTSGLVILR